MSQTVMEGSRRDSLHRLLAASTKSPHTEFSVIGRWMSGFHGRAGLVQAIS